MNRKISIGLPLLFVLLTGCAELQMVAPAPTVENIQRAKAANMAPVAVGSFVPAKQLDPEADRSINIRSNMLRSPIGGSFAKYLGETLSTELRAAGLYDEKSTYVIDGELTRSMTDAAMGGGTGELAARFKVKRNGTVVYDKELTEKHSWESSFIGAVAIPAAVGEYTNLYRKLVGQLLQDPEFRKAVAK